LDLRCNFEAASKKPQSSTDGSWAFRQNTQVEFSNPRSIAVKKTETTFPEEVAYLFHKQLEEADLIVLNKIDLIDDNEMIYFTISMLN